MWLVLLNIFFLATTLLNMTNYSLLVFLSVLFDFHTLSVALSPKLTDGTWRHSSLKTGHQYMVSFFKISLSNFLKQFGSIVFGSVSQKGVNRTFVRDYFLWRMNPHMVIMRLTDMWTSFQKTMELSGTEE